MAKAGVDSPRDLDFGHRRLVGIVFTDIVRSTPQLYELHTGQWMRLLRAHWYQLRHLLSQFGGHLVDRTGDSLLATFPQATDGLLFARAAVTDPGDERICLRAGVHWGYVTKDPIVGLVAGRAIHFADRVMSFAMEGGVCVSDDAKHQIDAESPDSSRKIQWTPHDDCELKGVPGFHRVWRIA